MPNRRGAYRPRPYPFYIGCAKLIDSPTNSFVGHVYPTFDQKPFNITETQVEPEIEPNSSFDDVRMEAVPRIN